MAIGVNLQKLMGSWNIRGMMMVSLGVQIALALAAPYRINASGSLTTFVVWSAYLASDWAAIYAFGLISNTVRATSVTSSEVNQNILALWASFLLIHMGGPDTITAYSLEDNGLWLRHLVRLVGQLAIFSYILLKTLPGNNLLTLTALVLVTGVLKYGERTRALFLASLDNLKGSVGKEPTRSLDRRLGSSVTGLIVDVMPRPSDLEKSRELYKNTDAKTALVRISRELKLIYYGLYTKIKAVSDKWGIYSRTIVYVTVLAELVLFCLLSKDQFDAVDVRITYCLLVRVFVVDMSRAAMRQEAGWFDVDADTGTCACLLDIGLMYLTFLPYVIFYTLSHCFTGLEEKLWSKKIGRFNLLDCSIQKYCRSRSRQQGDQPTFLDKAIDGCGLTDRVDKMKYAERRDFEEELWKFIFDSIQRKASNITNEEQAREVFESKGELGFREINQNELKKKYIEDFDFDKCVICWHIATKICDNIDKDKSNEHRRWSKTLSDYLMYLLIHQPTLKASIIGIGHERYAETCLEVKKSANKLGVVDLKDFCKKVTEGRGKVDGVSDLEKGGGMNDLEHQEEPKASENRGRGVNDNSVLSDGCDLASILMSDNSMKMVLKDHRFTFV